jgi:hypothetical protein
VFATFATLAVHATRLWTVQASGPLREGEVPAWWHRTTVRTEKRRMLDRLVDDSIYRRRENNEIRLNDDQRVEVPAVICVDCFTPSNITHLLTAIDDWPIQPPEYLESLQQSIREWRNSRGGGAWSLVAEFARPGSRVFDSIRDNTLPDSIDSVELILANPVPSLTLLIAVFYPSSEFQDKLNNGLRGNFASRIDTTNFRAKGKLARFTCSLPFSRAKDVYFAANFSLPTQLQMEWCDERFAELEAYCWHWLRRRAVGTLGALPDRRRPSIRMILTENLEPFGPIERHRKPEPPSLANWQDETNEEPIGGRRGPLDALRLSHASRMWTTPERDSFYFSKVNVKSDSAVETAFISADKQTLHGVISHGETFSSASLASKLVRNYLLGLIDAWAIEQTLAKYRDSISNVRDSTTLKRSAIDVANSLNEFLVNDGHDATIVTRDVIRISALDYSFRETPNLIDYEELEYLADGGDPTKLVVHYRESLSSDARLVAEEIDSTTRSISTSATLLQSVSAIHLQWWSLVMAVLAVVIAVIAII